MAEVVLFPASDSAAREQALDIRSSCIVEAPAGSGKTGLLVQRYLKLLADDEVQSPEEVLAVTFTRKATAELRERVLEQLVAASQSGDSLPADAKPFERASRTLALAALERSERLKWQLLEQPLRLNISTFDAVSMQIANALPILSGSGGPREPVDDARPLYRQAARRTLLELGGNDRKLHESLRTLLLHRDGNLADCEDLITEMLGSREQWGELVPLDASLDDAVLDTVVRPRLERALEAVVIAGLERARAAMPAGTLEELCAHAERLSAMPGYGGAPSPLAICAGKRTPPATHPDHLEHWHALLCLLLTQKSEWRSSFNTNHVYFEASKEDKALLKRFVQEIQSDTLHDALKAVRQLPPARYPDDQWAVAKALFFVLRHALAELKVLFASRGECDFTELALAAREALSQADVGDGGEFSASDLALASGGHLRHLLIDEMQDTSAGQYELIELLTKSWDGGTQTLFLVGDPKQSIYLFRAARVERFLRTMQEGRLGEIALKPLRLTANFRSQAKLVTDFNESFSRLFPAPGKSSAANAEVPFVEATATRESTQTLGIMWHPTVLEDVPLVVGTDHAEAEAYFIRSRIEERLSMPLPPGRTKPWQVAVLGHGRKHLAAVVKELQRAELPFKAIDIAPLADRPEVLDALALTRALLHPADRIAWLAVLHAPWCGLGLADMLQLTGDGEDATSTMMMLVERHGSRLSEEGQRLLDRAWPVLESAASTLGRTAISVHVERTWRSLGADVALTADQQMNVQRYFGVLRELEADGGRMDLDRLQARIDSLYAEPYTGQCQIELLTIHKSKGLEWDMVLVPGLERGSGGRDTRLLNWLEFDTDSSEVDAAVILAPIDRKGSSAGALTRWLNTLRTQRELAERKRLFYVACTRAKEELHLFAARKRKKDGSLRAPGQSSLLKACLPAAEEPFVNWSALAVNEAGDGAEEAALLDLAANADPARERTPTPATILRLPMSFDPEERAVTAFARRLDYPPAVVLASTPPFDRPEGSFTVRAFGNVVHRYLQVLADKLATRPVAALLAEVQMWQPRLEASLRGEGVPPGVATREATRALRALTLSLGDPAGVWILSPHAEAASESDLRLANAETAAFRVDRTFVAGTGLLSEGDSHIWIVDFKTTEQGSRSDAAFAETEIAKYRGQMETYARLRRALPGGERPIRLALFYPLAPKVLHWDSPYGTHA